MLSASIRSKVDNLWDKFWSGGIANPSVPTPERKDCADRTAMTALSDMIPQTAWSASATSPSSDLVTVWNSPRTVLHSQTR